MLDQITQYAVNEFQTDLTKVSRVSAQQLRQIAPHFKLTPEQCLFELLPLAARFALTPVSGFKVGAIAIGLSGTAYFGANMEWAGVPLSLTIHAEQAAINHAWLAGETGISDLYVNENPCGHCRQFMNELSTADQFTIHVKSCVPQTLQQLLPDSFGPEDLGVIDKLMAPPTSSSKPPGLNDELAAIWARCYAPYSRSPSVCVITLVTGERYYGAYAENAAFNPSISPLQSALIMLRLDHADVKQISGVDLYEREYNKISHKSVSNALLDAICPGAVLHCHLV